MQPVPGYVYYISDDYNRDVADPCLMQNKGEHHGRPCYCCKLSQETGLYWMIPLSSQKNKYWQKYNQSVAKYGNCMNLVLGKYAGRDTAFLIQNAFPVTEKYVKDIYNINGNPIYVHTKLQKIIYSKFQSCLAIHRKGYKPFYTDIDKAQAVMLQQLQTKGSRTSLDDLISSAASTRQSRETCHEREKIAR